MFIDARKVISESRVKLYWALEPDNEKNDDFGSNSHGNSLYSLLTVFW